MAFLFLKLPAELRVRIYEELGVPKKKFPAIFRVCKQITAEATREFEKTTLQVWIHADTVIVPEGAETITWLRINGKDQRSYKKNGGMRLGKPGGHSWELAVLRAKKVNVEIILDYPDTMLGPRLGNYRRKLEFLEVRHYATVLGLLIKAGEAKEIKVSLDNHADAEHCRIMQILGQFAIRSKKMRFQTRYVTDRYWREELEQIANGELGYPNNFEHIERSLSRD